MAHDLAGLHAAERLGDDEATLLLVPLLDEPIDETLREHDVADENAPRLPVAVDAV